MIELGVNIDHIATLRKARGTTYPDPVQAALLAEQAGADAITLHLREDRRHIQDADVERLRPLLTTRMNFECAINPEMLDIVARIHPQDVCLVPERRQEITTEGGLDVVGKFDEVQRAVQQLMQQGMRVSLFIDPDAEQIRASHATGATVIELHTGQYAHADTPDHIAHELQRIRTAVTAGIQHGLKVNAGHGLHYQNTQAIAAIPGIRELNIGHAIVAHALFVGWEKAVRDMKALITQAASKK